MKIRIKRKFIPNHEIPSLVIKYDWDISGESIDEKVADLHLFCISIVKDLIEETFKTDQEGYVFYKNVKMKKRTKKDLHKLYEVISEQLIEETFESDPIKKIVRNSKN